MQIDIDRRRAPRYGIRVEDIQNEIEVALAGRAVSYAPMALPVLGGLRISDEVVDLFLPVLFLPVRFYRIRQARWLKLQQQKRPRAAEQPQIAALAQADA